MNGFSSIWQKRVFYFLLGFVFLYKFFDAFTIQTHGDPFVYHLTGAKILFNHGWSALVQDLQIYAQAGIWDLVYLVPFIFTSNPIAIQLAGQLLHLSVGLFLSAALFIKWIPNRALAVLGAIAVLTISRDSAFFVYAKNDGAVATATLWACYLIAQRRSPLWIGFALGLAASVKISGLLSSGVLGAMYAIIMWREQQGREKIRSTAIAAATALITVAPMLIKNYLMIGNPLFPAMVHRWPGTLSEAGIKVYTMFFSTHATWDTFLINSHELLLGKVVYLLAFALAPYKIYKRDYRGLEYFVAALAIFIITAVSNGTPQGARFYFSTFFLLLFFTFNELAQLRYNPRWNWALLALVLLDSRIEMAPRAFKNIPELANHSTAELLDRHIIQWGYMKLVDPNPPTTQFIYSDNVSESFQLPPLYRFTRAQNSKDGDFMLRCQSPEDVAKLDRYRYFFLMIAGTNPCYQKVLQQGKHLGGADVDTHARVEVYEKAW